MSGVDLQVPRMEAYQQIYGNGGSFNDLKQTAKHDQREALRPVAEQFEALFLSQILKEARKVKLDDGWLDGDQGEFYKDWYDRQLGQVLSTKGSLGLADKIVEELAPKLPTVSKSEDKALSNQGSKQTEAPIEDNTQSHNETTPAQTTADSLALRRFR
ncbi:flagellar biosynthesis [Thiomicrospira sp. XS5]|nr:flagellar biosynthesis [Thiomicrospira sp. XS5]